MTRGAYNSPQLPTAGPLPVRQALSLPALTRRKESLAGVPDGACVPTARAGRRSGSRRRPEALRRRRRPPPRPHRRLGHRPPRRARRVDVEIRREGRLVATVKAARPRRDLEAPASAPAATASPASSTRRSSRASSSPSPPPPAPPTAPPSELRRAGAVDGGQPERRLIERIFEVVRRCPPSPPNNRTKLDAAIERLELAQARIEAALAALEPPPRRRPWPASGSSLGIAAALARRRSRSASPRCSCPDRHRHARAPSILFVHDSFPGQFGALGRCLAARGWQVAFATAARGGRRRTGIRLLSLRPPPRRLRRRPTPTPSRWTAPRSGPRPSPAPPWRPARGLAPDVVVAHAGWGAGMFARDVFPERGVVAYCEWWYRHPGPDVA